jgi:hypothetical protein
MVRKDGGTDDDRLHKVVNGGSRIKGVRMRYSSSYGMAVASQLI